VEVEVRVDSNAARGMASRRGLGRTRHLEVRHLWLQQAVERRIVTLSRVMRTPNPADVLTKLRAFTDATSLLKLVGME
jgi:hypothetical protein